MRVGHGRCLTLGRRQALSYLPPPCTWQPTLRQKSLTAAAYLEMSPFRGARWAGRRATASMQPRQSLQAS